MCVGATRTLVLESIGDPDETSDCGGGDTIDCYSNRRLQIGYYDGDVTSVGVYWVNKPLWQEARAHVYGQWNILDDLPIAVRGSTDEFTEWLADTPLDVRKYDDSVTIELEAGAKAIFEGGRLASIQTSREP